MFEKFNIIYFGKNDLYKILLNVYNFGYSKKKEVSVQKKLSKYE